MASTLDTKPPLALSESDEKTEYVQPDYLAQDETPDAIETKKKEDALRRKLDRYVAPVMMMLMLISYLDRGNIGFAATQGMTTDINLKGSELNVSLSNAIGLGSSELKMIRLPYLCFISSIFLQR
jgi:hypothetical protein